MNGIVAPDLVDRLLLFGGAVGPPVGIIIGAMFGAHERSSSLRVVGGFLIGLIPTLIYGMWRLYSHITDTMGLESARGFVLALAIFAVVGFCLGAIGVALRRYLRRRLGPEKVSRHKRGN